MQIGADQDSRSQVRPAEPGSGEVCLLKIGVDEVSLLQTGIDKDGVPEQGTGQSGTGQVCLPQIAFDQLGPMKMLSATAEFGTSLNGSIVGHCVVSVVCQSLSVAVGTRPSSRPRMR